MSGDLAILELKNLTKRFGGLVAVNDVSFSIREGGISGLIGPNGAGKTTIFNVISGLQSVSSGQVLLDGRDITRLSPTKRARQGMGRTFQRLASPRHQRPAGRWEAGVRPVVYFPCHDRTY